MGNVDREFSTIIASSLWPNAVYAFFVDDRSVRIPSLILSAARTSPSACGILLAFESITALHIKRCTTMSQHNRRFLRIAVAEAIVLALGVLVLVLVTLAVDDNAQMITAPFRLQ
jgi:hypothetical protein